MTNEAQTISKSNTKPIVCGPKCIQTRRDRETPEPEKDKERESGKETDREICVTVVPVPVPVSGQQTTVDKDKTSQAGLAQFAGRDRDS